MLAALLLLPLACPPTIVGGDRSPDQRGRGFTSAYGIAVDPRARAPRAEPLAPDLPLWDLGLALEELEPLDPETRWVAWALAAGKPATAYGHLVAALANDSLSAARVLWWREHVVDALDARDALFDAWDAAKVPSTRALLAVGIALALWDASCPVDPGADMACRVSGQVVRRDPIAVEEAQRWTARALESSRELDRSDPAVAALAQELALAAATVDYEVMLTVRMPEDLDFVVEDWRRDSGVPAWERKYARQVEKAESSKQRVGRFFDTTLECTRAMSELHGDAVEHGDADVAVLALLREATLAIALEGAHFGDGSSRDERRWAREERELGQRRWVCGSYSSGYLQLAHTLLEQCVELGTNWAGTGEVVDACLALQSTLDPTLHPEQSELIPEPVARSSVQGHGVIALE